MGGRPREGTVDRGIFGDEGKGLRLEIVGFGVEVSQEIEEVVESGEDGTEILGGSEESGIESGVRGSLSFGSYLLRVYLLLQSEE